MNLVIDFDENVIHKIISSAVSKVFLSSQYGNNGELYDYVVERTKVACIQVINEIDIAALIKESTVCYTRGIVEDVVKKELERMVKAQVKEMKAKGVFVQQSSAIGYNNDQSSGITTERPRWFFSGWF